MPAARADCRAQAQHLPAGRADQGLSLLVAHDIAAPGDCMSVHVQTVCPCTCTWQPVQRPTALGAHVPHSYYTSSAAAAS